MRRTIGRTGRMRRPAVVVAMAIVSIGALAAARIVPLRIRDDLYGTKLEAARLMAEGTRAIGGERRARGLSVGTDIDANMTGLVGPEYTALVTTLGPLEVKRSTTNPDFAAVMVDLLHEAGVRDGGLVAAGISGSFPGLALALYCAAEAMDLDLVPIASMGASTFGATDPDFTWLDMEAVLVREGIASVRSAAASVGGDDDRLENPFFPGAAGLAVAAIERNGVDLLSHTDLRQAVDARMSLYRARAGSRRIEAFVNIGGAEVNLGEGDSGRILPSGLVGDYPEGFAESRGVAAAMAAECVPVINMLDIRELCLRYGLPIDPIPLPVPGTSAVYLARASPLFPAVILLVLLATLAQLVVLGRKAREFVPEGL